MPAPVVMALIGQRWRRHLVLTAGLLVLSSASSASAQQTCRARCPDGSESERFDCSDASYVPICLRKRPATPPPQPAYRAPPAPPVTAPPPIVPDPGRPLSAAAPRAIDLGARDAAAAQLKGVGGAPATPAQAGLKGLSPALKDSTTPGPTYTFAGNGFIGGTTWRTGFYSPIGASVEVREHALQRWREQAKLNGGPDDTTVDTDRYNFVIGVAASTTAWRDLGTRVIFDQLHNGAYTRNNANSLFDVQQGYNALKGKRFDELGCHSNGAMVCLAALVNRDIAADRVVLYGPQVTPESLRIWNSLVVGKQIKSLTIFVNENDPVAPMAMLANGSPPVDQALLVGPMLYKANALRSVILSFAPRAIVRAYACGSSLSVACHDMARYTAASKCDASAGAVAGTTTNGRATVAPPSPACTRIP